MHMDTKEALFKRKTVSIGLYESDCHIPSSTTDSCNLSLSDSQSIACPLDDMSLILSIEI